MGFQVGWVAVKTESPEQVLNSMGLTLTEKTDKIPDYKMSSVSLHNGWFVLSINEFLSPLLDDPQLSKLSVEGDLVSCQLHEGIMASTITCFRSGCKVYASVHNAQLGATHIEEEGELPDIYNELKSEADINQISTSDVDFYFDIPMNLAEKIVGYRHDKALSNDQLFNEVIIKKQVITPSINVQNEPVPFQLSGIIEDLQSIGYFYRLFVLFTTILVCVLVGVGLVKLSVPQPIIPFMLAPITFFIPLFICKKIRGLERNLAIIQATIISAICVIAYIIKMLMN